MKKYIVITFGCQMNKADSETIEGLLTGYSYKKTDIIKDADIILINTCTVRQHAEDRALSYLGRACKIKRNSKTKKIIGLLGCIAAKEKEQLKKRFKELDIILPPGNIDKFKKFLENLSNKQDLIIRDVGDYIDNGLLKKRYSNKSAFVNIMQGCNNYCTYCIVPYVRGKIICREYEDILKEIVFLLENNYKEIILLGQNVNAYFDKKNKISFTGLIKKIIKLKYDFYLKFVTSHPAFIGDDLIEIYREKKIAPYLHLPLQSASNRILKLMNRKYTIEDYNNIIQKIKKIDENIALSTDIIVGFPSESREDFEKTKEYLAKTEYDNVYIFKYSDRPLAKAREMENKVPKKEIELRHDILLKMQQKIGEKKNRNLINKNIKVLVEGISPKNKEEYQGRTLSNKIVIFNSPKKINDWTNVFIKTAKSYTLFGEVK